MSATINWPEVISALVESGYTQADLARLCAVTPPTISDLRKGKCKKTDYAIGAKLLALLPKHFTGADTEAYQCGVQDTIDKLVAAGVVDMRAALLALIGGGKV